MTDPRDEPAGDRLRRFQAAERAHGAHAQAAAAVHAPLVAMGNEILKVVALLNGGAAVATLLLVSSTLRDDRPMTLALVAPLTLFGFGLTVSAFATGWSYFAQAQYGLALTLQQRTWSEPFIVDTDGSRAAARRGDRFRGLGLAAVFVGMGSAVGGFGLAGAILWLYLR